MCVHEAKKTGRNGREIQDSEETGSTKTAYNVVREPASARRRVPTRAVSRSWKRRRWIRLVQVRAQLPAKVDGTAAIARWPDL